MRFICNRQELSKSLNIVSKAVSSRTTIPALKGILLKVEGNELILTASDMDITIEDRIKIVNSEDGEIIAPAKLFGDIVRKLPGEDLTVEVNDDIIYINSLKTDYNLTGMKADEFVNIKNTEDDKAVLSFNKKLFTDMVKKTSFAASIDQTKGVITGVLIELKKNTLKMVAIDGYRMAITKEESLNEENRNIIISSRIINDMVKIISETEGRTEDEDMKFMVDSKSAILLIGKTKVIMRLVAGEFIKYQDIIPKEALIKVRLNRHDLIESVERASIFSKEGKNNLIKLSLNGDVMTITSRSEEGNVKEEVMITKEGDDLDIGFNAKYVMDMLKAIDDEQIMIEFNTGRAPCAVKPLEGDKYTYIILPVRISN